MEAKTDFSNEKFVVGGVRMPRPFKIGRLGHLGLYVSDIEQSLKFYCDLLGFRKTDELQGDAAGPNPRGVFMTHSADHHSLVFIHDSVGEARGKRISRGITINQMSFQVGTLEEVVAAYQLMRHGEKEIWRVGRDVPGSNYAVYFQDPDDHIVEIFYGMEQIGWDRRSKPKEFKRFAAVEEPPLPQPPEQNEIDFLIRKFGSLSEGVHSIDSGAAVYNVGGILLPRPFKIQRTGPIKLFVDNVQESIHFYKDWLGFSITEEISFQGHRCAFLRSGTEHHAIGLFPKALRTMLGLSEKTSMMSFGLQVGSYAQLKNAVEFLRSRDVQFIDLPCELSPGIDYTAHFLDSAGHCLQLYYYMEQIGWDGRPRPNAIQKSSRIDEWPESVDAQSDAFADRTFQGPIG